MTNAILGNSGVGIGTSTRCLCIFSDPRRRNLLTKNREMWVNMEKRKTGGRSLHITTTPRTKHTPKAPSLFSLKKITLSEMDTTTDTVYDGYVLEVRVVDRPLVMASVMMVVEDEDRAVEKLAVYNWPNTSDAAKLWEDFAVGRKLSIVNPYMRLAADRQSMIRVESPAYIVLGEEVSTQMCHCCGVATATIMWCGKCRTARYCSKECQVHDWTEFKHKLVCAHLKKYSVVSFVRKE